MSKLKTKKCKTCKGTGERPPITDNSKQVGLIKTEDNYLDCCSTCNGTGRDPGDLDGDSDFFKQKP